MLTHLIPLSQFVDKIDEIVPGERYFESGRIRQFAIIKRYTLFLLQPLELNYFVPVSDSGEVLEEPQPGLINDWYFDSALDEYRKAKEKCLFEGFEFINNKLFLNEKLVWFGELKGKAEDLTHLNLPLTAQAIKQILG